MRLLQCRSGLFENHRTQGQSGKPDASGAVIPPKKCGPCAFVYGRGGGPAVKVLRPLFFEPLIVFSPRFGGVGIFLPDYSLEADLFGCGRPRFRAWNGRRFFLFFFFFFGGAASFGSFSRFSRCYLPSPALPAGPVMAVVFNRALVPRLLPF